jgi:pimeloyl-ACP methyl ester carboxylesterase
LKGNYIQAYEHSSKGEPILFLHYMGGNSFIWDNILSYFTDQFRVITMDLLGHGSSDKPEDGYDMDSMAEYVLELLDTLNISKTHLVGSSLGCYVGTHLAALYPGRVLSLTNSEGAMQNITGPKGRFTETKEEFLQKFFSHPETTYASRAEYIKYMKENRIFRQFASTLYDVHLEDWFEMVKCPVLFLPAEKEGDLQGKLEFIRLVRPLLCYSLTEVIPDSTHEMMFDHGKEMSEAILHFYDKLLKKNQPSST